MTAPLFEGSGHELVIEWSRGYLGAKVECHAEAGAKCRIVCDQGCDEWYGPLITQDGSVWHPVHERATKALIGISDSWHRMRDDGECNVELFINESGVIEESATEGHPSFIAGRVPIEPVWDGDGYLWTATPAPLADGSGE